MQDKTGELIKIYRCPTCTKEVNLKDKLCHTCGMWLKTQEDMEGLSMDDVDDEFYLRLDEDLEC